MPCNCCLESYFKLKLPVYYEKYFDALTFIMNRLPHGNRGRMSSWGNQGPMSSWRNQGQGE